MSFFGDVGGFFAGGALGGLAANALFPNRGGGGGGSNAYTGQIPYPTYVGMNPDATQIGENPALTKYNDYAMRSGPSSATNLALTENTKNANLARAQASKMATGNAANAEADLSMKGGMGAGARERINKYSGNEALNFANAADANAGQNRANLMVGDENARLGALENSGKDQYSMAADNMKRKQDEYGRRNAYNLNTYDAQMGAWSAGKQADATANSGKK